MQRTLAENHFMQHQDADRILNVRTSHAQKHFVFNENTQNSERFYVIYIFTISTMLLVSDTM
jgi:hypothetical protein